MALETYACGLRLPRQFVAQGFNGQNEESSKLEDVIDLSKPALHTLLKGLAALLVQLYPDITPKVPSSTSKEKKEEPIKIFRQIMQIPGPMYPPTPSMYPCHQVCRQDQIQNQQSPQIPQESLQNIQMHSHDPCHQMSPQASQEPRLQEYPSVQSSQITGDCFPPSQPNPFFPDC
ncbi:hypothetical protein GE061_019666 [Apolygus lucorum]|uniref:Uncharacterized protein n=1 Tax=Apolygus lucorum TaxID=248454 RepID=A0A6A4JPS2_APOLU|nr:hypothetical protein GE061_019666 [Apolygus lucorum]